LLENESQEKVKNRRKLRKGLKCRKRYGNRITSRGEEMEWTGWNKDSATKIDSEEVKEGPRLDRGDKRLSILFETR